MSAGLLMAMLARGPALAQTPASLEAMPSASAEEAAFRQATALFDDGRYQEAADKLRALFSNERGRKASTALTLAQCERYLGDFASALYHFAFAAGVYLERDDEDDRKWREVIREHVATIAGNLVAVDVQIGAGGQEAPGDVLCGVSVDYRDPVKLDLQALQAALGQPTVAQAPRLRALMETLGGGWLAGVAGQPTRIGACRESATLPDRIRLIMTRTRAHRLHVQRRVGGALRPASVIVTFEDLQQPNPTVKLRELRAEVLLEPTVDSANARPDAVRASLAPLNGRAQAAYPLLWREATEIPAGRYYPEVNVQGLQVSLRPGPIDLLPGESRSLQVKLTAPPPPPALHRRPWFLFACSTLLVGALVGTVLAVENKPSRSPVDTGSLGWMVKVP
jgi:hypothetical protein